MKKIINKENVFYLAITFVSLFFSVAIFLDENCPTFYRFLPLLPFSYSLINLLSRRIYNGIFNIKENLAVLIIHLLYFVRQSLAIYILMLGNYYSALNKLTEDNCTRAIFLMILDSVIVYIFLNNYKRIVIGNKRIFSVSLKKQKLGNRGSIATVITIAISLFCIVTYMVSPLIKNSYSAIWNISLQVDNYFLMKNNYQGGSAERILFTLFTQVFDFARIFVPCWIMYFCRKKIGQKPICLIIAMLLCVFQFSMILNENMYVLIVTFIFVLFVMRIFPKYASGIKAVLIVGGATIVIAYFSMTMLVVASSTSGMESVSTMFQEYFPGVSNIACGFNIIDPNKMETLFYDIYETIPYHNTLFGLDGVRMSDLYNTFNGVKYKITPCLIQSYHYLGFFAPIISCLFVKIALSSQYKVQYAEDIFSYCAYMLLFILSAMTPICYYPTIFYSRYFSTILPMIIIARFSGSKYSIDFTK